MSENKRICVCCIDNQLVINLTLGCTGSRKFLAMIRISHSGPEEMLKRKLFCLDQAKRILFLNRICLVFVWFILDFDAELFGIVAVVDY